MIASRRRLLLLATLLALPACRSPESKPDAAAPPVPLGTSTAAPAAPAPPSAAGCASDADCAAGTVCFFSNAGCDARAKDGHCAAPSWSHECAANRPVCSCDGRTLWGNNCADVQRERWATLGACGCGRDSDCKAGQICSFPSRGCDARGVCEDAKRLSCAEERSFCACSGKTLGKTFVRALREPWSKAGACP